MKVRMINNESTITESEGGLPSVISANITIKVKTETDEDVSRYHDLITAIEQAIDEVTVTPEILPEANWGTV